jgi:hypothetical protein
VVIDFLFRVAERSSSSRPINSSILDFLSGSKPDLPRTGPLIPPDVDAEFGIMLLQRADARMNRLRSLSECNNINGIITLLDYSAPDRMRYVVEDGGQSIIHRDQQWYRRSSEPWQLRPRSENFSFPRFDYSQHASGVRLEGEYKLDGRTLQLVSFYNTRDEADYWFWIDAQDYRIHHLVMNAPPSHYMVSIFEYLDDPAEVLEPDTLDDFSVTSEPKSSDIPCKSYLPKP